jgi:hypothetical protein
VRGMLQSFFKLVLRVTGRHQFPAAGAEPGLPSGEACPKPVAPEFPTQTPQLASAPISIRRKGGRAMHQSPNEPRSKHDPHAVEEPDGKVVRLMPRSRPAPERLPDPPHCDDDDPGPSAA